MADSNKLPHPAVTLARVLGLRSDRMADMSINYDSSMIIEVIVKYRIELTDELKEQMSIAIKKSHSEIKKFDVEGGDDVPTC